MTPEEELRKIQTENFAGGQYYGRTPGGIVDLRSGQIVPSSAQYGTSSAGATPIANSTVRRYTGTISDTGQPSYQGEVDRFIKGLDITPPSEQEVIDIRDKEFAAVQRQLDAIDAATSTLLSDESRRAETRLGRTRAMSARGGRLGSDFGERERVVTEDVNKDARNAVIQAQEAKKLAIFDKANQRAADIAQQQKTEALTNAELFMKFMAQKQEDARADLKVLAGSGVAINSLSEQQYNTLREQTGYDPFVFDAIYNSSLPAAQKKDYEYINLGSGKVVRFDKAGGSPEYFDYSVPEGFQFKMAGDIPVFVNEKTQEVKVAGVAGASDAGAFVKETELDSFTDASGNRISVMYNPVTKKTRQITHGKTEGSSGFGTGFKPQAFEASAVQQFIANEGRKQGQSKEEIDEAIKAAQNDPGFFYSVLGTVLANEEYTKNYYKPTTLGIPTTVQISQ